MSFTQDGRVSDWLRDSRGRDVNPDGTWIPFVTLWNRRRTWPSVRIPLTAPVHRHGADLVPAWGAALGRVPGQDYVRIVDCVEKAV